MRFGANDVLLYIGSKPKIAKGMLTKLQMIKTCKGRKESLAKMMPVIMMML